MVLLYISGVYALNLPCSLNTAGDWHTSSMDWSSIDIRDSSASIFSDWGIEACNFPALTHVKNIANHLRAVLDIMESNTNPRIDWLKGFRDDFFCTDEYNDLFFSKVVLLNKTPHWSDIDDLMLREYKLLWRDWRISHGTSI